MNESLRYMTCIKVFKRNQQETAHQVTASSCKITSDRPKQDFMAETEPKPNFGYNSSFGRNRNTKEIEINDFVHT